MYKLISLLLTAMFLTSCAFSQLEEEEQNTRFGEIHEEAGIKALLRGRFSEAIGFFRKGLKHTPRNPTTWGHLGIAYFKKGAHAEAEDALKKSITIDPKLTIMKNNLGFLYYKMNKLAKARAIFYQSLKDLEYPRQHETYFFLALTFIKEKRWLKAEYELQRSVKENKHHCSGWLRLGKVRWKQYKKESAFEALGKASSGLCYGYAEAHYFFGEMLMRAHEYTDAKKKLLEVMDRFPQTVWAERSLKDLVALEKRL